MSALTQSSDVSFAIKLISVDKFHFDKKLIVSHDEKIILSLNISVGKIDVNESDVQVVLFSKIDLEKEDKTVVTTFDTVLSAVITPNSNNEKIDNVIKNIAAILYSYLRPLIAQMTVMSKLQPLDLPPLNFTDINYADLSEMSDNKECTKDADRASEPQ